MEQKGIYLAPLGKVIYFKPDNDRAVHFSYRIDLETGEKVQDFQPNTCPFFITGSNKADDIQSNAMLKRLYKQFENELKTSSDLLIIGFSFKDEHIKNVIMKNIKKYNPLVINVNPENLIDSSYMNIIRLKDISELNKKNCDKFFEETNISIDFKVC